MTDCLSSEVEKVISDYIPVLNRMPHSKSNDLINGILQMKKYGVEAFATRVVYKNGLSSMFCTSVNWARINQDKEFKEDFRNHLSSEIVKILKDKTKLISRSGDKTNSPFLRRLQGAGVNNSIIEYEFYQDKMEVVYFMANPEDPDARDKIINNLECLKFLKKTIRSPMQEIVMSEEFKAKKELVLNSSALECVWNKNSGKEKSTKLMIGGRYHNLSYRELECLGFLRFGGSNQVIAEHLDISVATVKYHLSNVKSKLSLSSRQDMIEVAQNPSIINISKTIGAI